MDNNTKLLSIKDKKVAINCATYDEAKELMLLFARNRITWRLGVSAETKTNWEKDGPDTCYTLDNVGIAYSHRHFYEREGYKIVSFSRFFTKDKKVVDKKVSDSLLMLDCIEVCRKIANTKNCIGINRAGVINKRKYKKAIAVLLKRQYIEPIAGTRYYSNTHKGYMLYVTTSQALETINY